uniref:Uncharacterized protein n=1 Tax=Rhizophora mucronata TaxID=61149 RepID=A0A2P2R1E3_RHIMU
MELKRKIQELR